jgi:superfamily II helicase
MTTDKEKAFQKFEKLLEKKPKLLESMARKEELEEFKETYSVERRTKLCCPVCTMGWNRGKLYQSTKDPEVFTCKNCLITLRISPARPDTTSASWTIEELLDRLDAEAKARREAEKE